MSTMLMGALIFVCGLHFGRAEKGLEVISHQISQVAFAEKRPTEVFLWSSFVILASGIIFSVAWMFLKRKDEEMITQKNHFLKIPSEITITPPVVPTIDTYTKISLKARKLPTFSDVDTGESMSCTMIRTREWALGNGSSHSVGETPLKRDWEDWTEKEDIETVKKPVEDQAGDTHLGEAVGESPEPLSKDSLVFMSDRTGDEVELNEGKGLREELKEGGLEDGESLEARKQREIERYEAALIVLQRKEKELKELEEENERLAKETTRKVQGKAPAERERELDDQILSLEKALADETMRTAELAAELEILEGNDERSNG
ncbi:hypothetical protein BSKO_12114 [Bryopsis sp. KO-2023]|nr:hypothetical protein BSKO_12114 [Bryopsis sp. KO-2023]